MSEEKKSTWNHRKLSRNLFIENSICIEFKFYWFYLRFIGNIENNLIIWLIDSFAHYFLFIWCWKRINHCANNDDCDRIIQKEMEPSFFQTIWIHKLSVAILRSAPVTINLGTVCLMQNWRTHRTYVIWIYNTHIYNTLLYWFLEQ